MQQTFTIPTITRFKSEVFMQQSFTVSQIAARTGIDRRSVDRALIDVEPASSQTHGDRTSRQYDRDQVTAALGEAGHDLSSIARLTPFGGSLTRLVAWNFAIVLVRQLQHAIAEDRTTWPKQFGVTVAQADGIGARTALIAAQVADDLLAHFGDRCPDTAELDTHVMPFDPPAKDSEPGAFLTALDFNDPLVAAMIESALKQRKPNA